LNPRTLEDNLNVFCKVMAYNRGEQAICEEKINRIPNEKDTGRSRRGRVIQTIVHDCPPVDVCNYDQRRYISE